MKQVLPPLTGKRGGQWKLQPEIEKQLGEGEATRRQNIKSFDGMVEKFRFFNPNVVGVATSMLFKELMPIVISILLVAPFCTGKVIATATERQRGRHVCPELHVLPVSVVVGVASSIGGRPREVPHRTSSAVATAPMQTNCHTRCHRGFGEIYAPRHQRRGSSE